LEREWVDGWYIHFAINSAPCGYEVNSICYPAVDGGPSYSVRHLVSSAAIEQVWKRNHRSENLIMHLERLIYTQLKKYRAEVARKLPQDPEPPPEGP
jgi:hypothetical protein